jgi:hypothetical protein
MTMKISMRVVTVVVVISFCTSELPAQERSSIAQDGVDDALAQAIADGTEIVRRSRDLIREQQIERIRSRARSGDAVVVFGEELLIEGAIAERMGAIEVHDFVRMQVGWIEGRERFGWPGSARLSADSASELLGVGAASSGEFVGHLQAVVDGLRGAMRSEYEGNKKGELRWTLSSPTPSGFRIATDRGTAEVAFKGVLAADAQEGRITKLLVYADDIPTALGITVVESAIAFHSREIAGRMRNLPSKAVIRSVYRDGRSIINIVSFGQQYT